MASSLTWDLCAARGKNAASPDDEFQASGFIILSESSCKGTAPWEKMGSSTTADLPVPVLVCNRAGSQTFHL